MGKPIVQAEGEVAKTVSFCKHFSHNFNDVLPNQIKTDAKKTLVKYDPLGTVYNIVPFNFPFFLNFKGGLSNLLLTKVSSGKNFCTAIIINYMGLFLI